MTWDGGEHGPLVAASSLVLILAGLLLVALALLEPAPQPALGGQPGATAVFATPRYRYAVSPTATIPVRSRPIPRPTRTAATGCRDHLPAPMSWRCLRLWVGANHLP